jgi:methionyl-tRNA synthetase
MDEITIEQFQGIDLRTGKVLEAEPVPGTSRLVKLRVDLGTEERQLVAGIAEAYEPDALVGRCIIVVANLKPARLKGVESQGMLLAATPEGSKPILATFDVDLPPGTKVR